MTVRELIEALVPYGDDVPLYIRVPLHMSWGVYPTLKVTEFMDKVFIDFIEENHACQDV